MIILNSIKKFLEWVFGARHWKKTLILLAVIIVGVMLIFKDCTLKTKTFSCGTETKLDMEKAKDMKNKLPQPPAQQ